MFSFDVQHENLMKSLLEPKLLPSIVATPNCSNKISCIFDELIDELKDLPRVDIAILPVNEDNFFRRKRGIIGNMSIREAFGLADLLNFKNVIPVHWDMFEFNSTLPEEIKSVNKGYKWNFKLFMDFAELLR